MKYLVSSKSPLIMTYLQTSSTHYWRENRMIAESQLFHSLPNSLLVTSEQCDSSLRYKMNLLVFISRQSALELRPSKVSQPRRQTPRIDHLLLSNSSYEYVSPAGLWMICIVFVRHDARKKHRAAENMIFSTFHAASRTRVLLLETILWNIQNQGCNHTTDASDHNQVTPILFQLFIWQWLGGGEWPSNYRQATPIAYISHTQTRMST